MPSAGYNYKKEYTRYRYYFGRIYQYYQKPAAKVSTALLLTIFTTIFFAVFAIRPTLVTIAELLRKIEDQRSTLTQMKKKAASLAAASQEYDAQAGVINRLNVAIPESAQIAPLLTYVEGVAAQDRIPLSGLTADTFEYAPPPASVPKEAQEYKLTFSAVSPYPALKNFVKNLFFIPRFLAIDSITLATKKDEETNATGEGITLDVNSRIFTLSKPVNSDNR